jgi:nucleotide-binding universal stress UspA family protein
MKRIVVPVDFSPYSQMALQAAVRIADKSGANVSLVNVVLTNLDWVGMSPQAQQKYPDILEQTRAADEKLEVLIRELPHPHVPVEKYVMHGYPYDQIVALAKRQEADLIIMGAYGKGHTSKNFIGSNIQKVLRMAPCPVLTVKNKTSGRQFKKLLFASNFDEQARPAFRKVKQLAKVFDATVHLVFINTPHKFVSTPKAESLMQAFIAENPDLRIRTHIYNFDDLENGLDHFVQDKGNCLVAMATRVRKLTGQYQMGVTETMVYRLEDPVLSAKMD